MAKERDPEMAAIGARVRESRLARGMTLEGLAEAADTSYQFLSQVEKGEQAMTMVKFGRLAKALGVSSDYLLFGHDPAQGRASLAADALAKMSPAERDLASRAVIAMGEALRELDRRDG